MHEQALLEQLQPRALEEQHPLEYALEEQHPLEYSLEVSQIRLLLQLQLKALDELQSVLELQQLTCELEQLHAKAFEELQSVLELQQLT